MSTTFKIIENHIENSRTSPKKSVALSSSQYLSPSSRARDSLNDSGSFQEQETLKLQIKQLQRENKFLKKKIAELTQQLSSSHQMPKRKNVLGKGAPKQETDPINMTIDFFFKQINNLMNSVTDMFRVQFTNDEAKQFSIKFALNDESLAANKKFFYYKKILLSRKLQKVSLESQEKRYPMLLDVFTQYYKNKEDCDKFVRLKIDELSARVLQLNKMIVDNASKKKNGLKSSCVKSQLNYDDINERNLLVPWSLKPTLTYDSTVTDSSTKRIERL